MNFVQFVLRPQYKLHKVHNSMPPLSKGAYLNQTW